MAHRQSLRFLLVHLPLRLPLLPVYHQYPRLLQPAQIIEMSFSISYTTLGDWAHVASLVSTLAFAGAVVWNSRREDTNWFDASWQRDGFCVAHADVPYWNSHDACLYVDTFFALILGLVYFYYRNNDVGGAHLLLATNVPGILMHGVGHGFLGKLVRDNKWGDDGNIKDVNMPVALAIQFAFWMALSRASMPNVSLFLCGLASLLAAFFQVVYVPGIFGFTYVQTVLMVEFDANQLARPIAEKNFAYALFPCMVGLPLTLIGWVESTCCTTFVKDWWYGHLAYDAYIPISILAWYALVRIHHGKEVTGEKVKVT